MINLNNSSISFIINSTQRIPNVSDEDYFGEKYADYVSNSSLKHLNPDEGGSSYNYKNRVAKQSNSLELGTAVHRATLEGDKYILCEVEKPTGKLAEVVEEAYRLSKIHANGACSDYMIDAMTRLNYYGKSLTGARRQTAIEDGREYFDFLCSTGNDGDKIILPIDQRAKFLKAIESIKQNTRVQALLNPSSDIFDVRSFSEDVILSEVDVEFEDELGTTVHRIPLKAKIDNWSIDFDNKVITLNDLKTTSRPVQEFMGRWSTSPQPFGPGGGRVTPVTEFVKGSFQKWHYHRQMHMYASMLVSHCIREYQLDENDFRDGTWTMNINMIVAETCAPFNTHVFPVDDEWLEAGAIELDSLLARVAWHEIHGWTKIIEFEHAG